MFDHVGIRVADRAASESFYRLVLSALGLAEPTGTEYLEWEDFSIGAAEPDRPVTTGLHVGFSAPSRDAVDAFWRAGTEAGHPDDGEPGPRPEYSPDYYGGFLRDPDANSAEAVHNGDLTGTGTVDHLWIRVSDLDRSRDFYSLVGRHAGFTLVDDRPDRAMFRGQVGNGSFSIVSGEPTANLHMAFPALTNDVVAEWHGAMLAAGHPDNGGPGERPEYHDGYFGAFVRDPDGNNIELVNHGS